MTVIATRTDSRVGPLLLTARDGVLTGLHYHGDRTAVPEKLREQPDAAIFVAVLEQLDAYFAGTLTAFDVLYELQGTQFQTTVWRALGDIPYGSTTTYAEIASRVGQPAAVRAVGAANGRNPIAIIVPCHRVVGSDGALTGYGGGIAAKRTLLDLEAGRLALEL